MQNELEKVMFITQALDYVKTLPSLDLFVYQRLSGVTGYNAALYYELNQFLDNLFHMDINHESFTTDMVEELLSQKLRDPVVYTLIAKRWNSTLKLLPENLKKTVEFYMTSQSDRELEQISSHVDKAQHILYCVHVSLDAQVLRSLRKKGVSVLNSQYLQFCSVNERTASDRELLTLVNSYAQKAVSFSKEWEAYKKYKGAIIDYRVIEYWANRDRTKYDVKALKTAYNQYLLSLVGM